MDELDLTVEMELFSYGCFKAPEVKKKPDCFILHFNGFRVRPSVIMSAQFASK